MSMLYALILSVVLGVAGVGVQQFRIANLKAEYAQAKAQNDVSQAEIAQLKASAIGRNRVIDSYASELALRDKQDAAVAARAAQAVSQAQSQARDADRTLKAFMARFAKAQANPDCAAKLKVDLSCAL